MRARWRLVCLMTMLAVTGVAAESAQACSCVSTPPGQLLERQDGAVIARLLSVTPASEQSRVADFRYRIGRVFKGRSGLQRGRTLVVRSSADGASCSLPTRERRLYGLFLDRRDSRWELERLLDGVSRADAKGRTRGGEGQPRRRFARAAGLLDAWLSPRTHPAWMQARMPRSRPNRDGGLTGAACPRLWPGLAISARTARSARGRSRAAAER